MKKTAILLLMLIVLAAPLAAATHKTGPERNYIGLAVGYNGVRESLVSMLAKVMGEVLAQGLTGGHAETGLEFIGENALALGIDGYFEVNRGFSMSSTLGCSVDWSGDGGVYPAPSGDVIFYGRLNGGDRGDFLLGSGIGTFCTIRDDGYQGYIALLAAMRYQLDISSNLGWWMDMTMGWNAFGYNANGILFIADGFSVMQGIRTGISYSF